MSVLALACVWVCVHGKTKKTSILTFMLHTYVRWTRLSVRSPTHFTASISDHYWPISFFTVPCYFLTHVSAGERVKIKNIHFLIFILRTKVRCYHHVVVVSTHFTFYLYLSSSLRSRVPYALGIVCILHDISYLL